MEKSWNFFLRFLWEPCKTLKEGGRRGRISKCAFIGPFWHSQGWPALDNFSNFLSWKIHVCYGNFSETLATIQKFIIFLLSLHKILKFV